MRPGTTLGKISRRGRGLDPILFQYSSRGFDIGQVVFAELCLIYNVERRHRTIASCVYEKGCRVLVDDACIPMGVTRREPLVLRKDARRSDVGL
jgi:hypothetical protein